MSDKQFNLHAGHTDKLDGTHFYGFIIRRTFKNSQISLTGTAANLITSALSGRVFLFLFNNSADIVYLGADNTVTAADGFPLYPRASIFFVIEDGVAVWGISSGSSSDIRMIEGS